MPEHVALQRRRLGGVLIERKEHADTMKLLVTVSIMGGL